MFRVRRLTRLTLLYCCSSQLRGGYWDFRFCSFGSFPDRFFRFFVPKNSGFSVSVFICGFPFFSILFSIFVKNHQWVFGFSIRCGFRFFLLGSGFSSIWAAMMHLHWSRIAAKPRHAPLVTDCIESIRVLIIRIWKFIVFGGFACRSQFWSNSFAVLDGFFPSILRFLIDPNAPLSWKNFFIHVQNFYFNLWQTSLLIKLGAGEPLEIRPSQL